MAFTDFKSIMQVQETYGIKYTQENYILQFQNQMP